MQSFFCGRPSRACVTFMWFVTAVAGLTVRVELRDKRTLLDKMLGLLDILLHILRCPIRA
jgi:hypothetical protein